ncbi:hypothetical protein F66182_677 [Fusarium sp. NRRL 66182]|nr:hypothetical protein F66182_677 [Fusarium sp. NRRL 66182]
MIHTLWKSPAGLDHSLPNRRDSEESVINRLGGKDLVVFCSSRVWRGAPKLMLQIFAIFFASFLIFGVLPDRLSGGQLASGYGGLFSWGKHEPEPESKLRIVVFGSPDVVGSVKDPKRRSWTEELCDQLQCSSHVSFITKSQPNRGLLSNSLYAKGVQRLLDVTQHTDVKQKPALDFDYIHEQYPAPFRVSDLSSQVQSFLDMPPPDDTPRETLWIFSFGTWEIWNMAAMPRAESEAIISSMVKVILDQAELLYQKSLDPVSNAYSDFWTNATEAQIRDLTAPGALDKVDRRKFESFRILAPMIFDVSLTPGWRSRSKPPAPNSLAEQTRNAAELTMYWNQEIDFAIAEWKERTTKSPKTISSEEGQGSNKKRSDNTETAVQGEATNGNDRVIQAPYPMRNGLALDIGKEVLNVMKENAMRQAAVVDMKGRGGGSDSNASMQFSDIWTPCVNAETADLSVEKPKMALECEDANDHLFYDSFTISQRAMKGVVKALLGEITKELFDTKAKGVPVKHTWLATAVMTPVFWINQTTDLLRARACRAQPAASLAPIIHTPLHTHTQINSNVSPPQQLGIAPTRLRSTPHKPKKIGIA